MQGLKANGQPAKAANPAAARQPSANGESNGKLRSDCRLTLVIPAWNEEDTIRQAIQEAEEALSGLVADYEIIVVDDGSSDRTAQIVQELETRNWHVRCLQHAGNRGYGAALRTGFEAARFDLVAFTDADCQFNLHELEYMLPLAQRYDITCGYRIDRQDPARRRFFSWGYNTLAKMLVGSPVHDIDCALKVFRRSQLLTILPECDNFFANTEMLANARRQGLSVVEVGVHHRGRAGGESKVSLRDIPRTLAALLPFWWNRVLFPGRNPETATLGAAFWACLLTVACLAAVLLFPKLSYPLVEPDEGRYAEIGREMLHSGDWIVPKLNDRTYADKPPLLYWLVALSLRFFGTHTWAARLVPAGAAFLTVLATFCLGSRTLGVRAGFLGAVALALMPGFVQSGRFLLTDGILTLFETVCLWTAYEACRGSRVRWSWWITSAACCALGVLTKGPVAPVTVAVPLVAFFWLNKNSARPRLLHWAVFAGLTCALAAPWYIAMIVRAPDFAWQFFIEHHLLRFFGPEYHEEPIWFYVPVVMVACLPWSLLLIPLAQFLLNRAPDLGSLRPGALGFLVLWAGWCLLFFSLSRGKLPTYILPALPAIGLLLGWYFDLMLFRFSGAGVFQRARSAVPQLTLWVLGLTWLIGNVVAWKMGLVGPRGLGWLTAGSIACLAGGGAVVAWGRALPPRIAWGLCVVLGFVLIVQVSQSFVPAWSARRSPLAGVRRLLEDRQVSAVCDGEEWGSVPFHLDHDENFLFTGDRTLGEVRAFVGGHPRTLLFVKDNSGMGLGAWPPSPGVSVVKVIPSGKAQVLVVQKTSMTVSETR
jgi:4-amino-4-deoxy-L-arabinose transferase-like glycosyltransferase